MKIYRLQDIEELGHTSERNWIRDEYFYTSLSAAQKTQAELAKYKELREHEIPAFLPIIQIEVKDGDG